jgi:hypothetical protein
MKFQFDAEKISLIELQKRIETSDLVPSRAILLDGLEAKIKIFEHLGLKTLAQLRAELKNANRSAALAIAARIELQYLVLLKREVESYFPKVFPLKELNWFHASVIASLEKNGVKDIAVLFEEAEEPEGRHSLAEMTGINDQILADLIRYADLTRVQWVSPITARMLIEAGYDSSFKLGNAEGITLFEALQQINRGGEYFKGTIGLRDVNRIIYAAHFVTTWYQP